MEVQTQLLHHNPYDIVKSEPVVDSPPKLLERKNSICPSSDMIFGVSNFIPNNFCANNNSNPTTNNNNNDHLANNNNNNNTNNNNVKLPNGRSLAADRKRPYPCNLCPSRFGSKMELEEHQNSHTGMKPFECDVCKARFNRRSTLWNHKRIHSDAKPFVCTVCQMTFKWKNSLKCHKEMHLRKNESSAHLDNDLRQLTYATAAKRRLLQEQENGGNAATSCANSIHSQPLITTTTPKKKNKSNAHNNLSNVHVNNIQQPLQASALIPPSDHSLDIDSSSLDTLVGGHQGNLFLHMYGDVPFLGDVDSRHPMLSGLDDPSMLSSQINSDKSDSPMGTTTAPINVHLPMQINMFNFRPVQPQLPSVHHLTSTSLSLDYSGQPTENSLGHPQYIVAAQPDMMISQHSLGYPQPLDQCVNSILVAGQDYVPNFDYQMLSSNYPMQPNDVDDQQGQQRVPPPDQSHQGRTQAPNVLGQQQRSDELIDEKVLPYEQW